MPLLWALRDVVQLTGTKFGCGISECGACTVHVDGEVTRSCVTPVSAVEGKEVTTIEAMANDATGQRVQRAWLDLGLPSVATARVDRSWRQPPCSRKIRNRMRSRSARP